MLYIYFDVVVPIVMRFFVFTDVGNMGADTLLVTLGAYQTKDSHTTFGPSFSPYHASQNTSRSIPRRNTWCAFHKHCPR